MKYKYGEFMQR